jgi:hypothetical protein
MNAILNIVGFEIKTLFRTMRWLPVLFLLFAFSISTFMGINHHKSSLSSIPDFLKSELNTFNAYKNYTDYSNIGLNVIVEPSVAEIFFTGPDKISEMSGRINSIAALEIDSNSKGLSIFSFAGNSSISFVFSQLALYLGSLLVFLLGADTFKKREYFRFLSSINRPFKIFFYVTAARAILLSLIFLLLLALTILLALFMGININSSFTVTLFGYAILTLTTYLFYFAAGTVTGLLFSNQSRRKNKRPHSYTLTIWFLLVIVLPGVISVVNSTNEKIVKSRYRLKAEKIKIIRDFEDRTKNMAGKFDRKNLVPFIEAAEGYYRNDYPMIEKLEIDELSKVSRYYERHNLVSMFFPTTAYQFTCNELSSKGYSTYIQFHRYLIQLKRRFVRFWIDRVYYNDPKVMVNFVRDNENVFHAESRFPGYFPLAVSLNLIYSLLLLLASGYLFKKWLFRLDDDELDKINDGEIQLEGKPYIFGICATDPAIRNYLFQVLAGNPQKRNFSGKLKLLKDSQEISNTPPSFLYICRSDYLPKHLKVIELLKLVQALSKNKNLRLETITKEKPLNDILETSIDRLEKTSVFHLQMALPSLVDKSLYYIDDIVNGLTMEEARIFISKLDEWVDKRKTVLYITGEDSFQPESKQDDEYGISTSFYYDLKARLKI